MQTFQLIRKFGRNDVKLITRDSFLVSMFFFVVLIALALRFGLPWLNGYLESRGVLPNQSDSRNLADFYPLVIAFMVIFQGPMIAGAIFGFSLLDEKDDNTIKAMLVTPVPFDRYVRYRISVPMAIGVLIVVFQVWFIGLAVVPFWQLLLLSVGASMVAPIAALFYAVTAENKVQGFAIAKFVGLVGWVILLAWFVSEPWQWLFGLFPPFLVSKAYWMALDANPMWWAALILGVLLQTGMLILLVARFHKVAYN